MNEGDIKGERLLFKAIIVRAVKDAFSRSKDSCSISSLDKRQARFFLCDDPAFQDYCDFAGVSAYRLRKIAKELCAMPDAEATALYRKWIKEEGGDL